MGRAGAVVRCIGPCRRELRGEPHLSIGVNPGKGSKVCPDCVDKALGVKSGHMARQIKIVTAAYGVGAKKTVTADDIVKAINSGALTKAQIRALLRTS